MKTRNLFAFAAALTGAMMIASCSKSDDIQDDTNRPVRFSGAIEGQVAATPVSRAADDRWGNDAIGIFMVGHGGTTVSESVVNYQYTTTGNDNFTPVSSVIYYPMSGAAVDFIAYYPYAANVTLDNEITVTIGDQTDAGQPTFDLLYAKADKGGNGYTKEDKDAVALKFDHKLAKIVMNCKADASVGATNLDDMTVTIKGTNSKNTFDLKTGTLGAANTEADVTPRKIATADGFDASYDAIIMPGEYGANTITVEFTIDGETFTWDVSEAHAKFDGGNEYTYEVTITRTGVSVSGSITSWETKGNNRGEVTAQ
ncbi:MAG: fimbrillin family protein [Alistipes sp.]|nr:fimbrillin family protein [Alistipes sp.]